jgi:hypothetical protein
MGLVTMAPRRGRLSTQGRLSDPARRTKPGPPPAPSRLLEGDRPSGRKRPAGLTLGALLASAWEDLATGAVACPVCGAEMRRGPGGERGSAGGESGSAGGESGSAAGEPGSVAGKPGGNGGERGSAGACSRCGSTLS